MKSFVLLAVSLISGSHGGYYHYHAQQIGSHKGFETYLSNGQPQSSVFLPSLRTTRRYNSISPFRNLVRKPSASNVVQQTKDLANTVTSVLEELANNPASASRVNQIISDNYSPCLTSIEDSIASLQSSSQLVESLGPELQSLTDRFTALRSVKEPAKVVRETGAVLKLLQPLADKTAKIESGNCPESLRSLALLVTEISEKPELRLKFSVRENLKKSSATLSIVNVFLSQLEPTIARMKRFCTDDNKYNRDAMVAIGDLMLDLESPNVLVTETLVELLISSTNLPLSLRRPVLSLSRNNWDQIFQSILISILPPAQSGDLVFKCHPTQQVQVVHVVQSTSKLT